MKKTVLLLFAVLFFVSNLSLSANEQSKELSFSDEAKSAILIERDTGEILYQDNAEEMLPPASMTKMMTLLLIMEAIEEGKIALDEQVRVSEYAASMGGSQIFLEAGEEMSVDDLLKAIAVASGNDASVALAERIAGSEPSFVEKMNQKVKKLGLKNTNFANTTGLPAENHYSTAHDMAVIARELLKHENITQYTSIYEDYLRKGTEDEFWLVNTNRLIKFYQGVDGLKTGYTSKAKYCLTATAKKDDMRLVAVVMGAETPKTRNHIISQLLDYGFSQYKTEQLFTRGEKVTDLSLPKANKDRVDVITEDAVSLLLKKGESSEDITTELHMSKELALPLEANSEVGKLLIKLDDQVISETNLLVAEDLEQASLWRLIKYSWRELLKSGR
ncbi:D-alanyl-D-alanine carboxypeptidase (penicillin-binding protein 5/6) [Natronobacillus azotifigens]|uniref:serine-type D-Ala-D-Ala carboxypeptidase n=1 Tax=Natronobacillus azotifigens TaxID=472978 RepID=A0A9J6R920_9BACI|nr:D-alanyl-D-alanine carboxypeptidase family protein [Natronobacillus azotifigens]MCZ0701811.1 D-alanyl-D-alanine carboxypeptidase [Natronobacillus azotifigens]